MAPTVSAVADQDAWESRKAWLPVAAAIRSGDMRATEIEKSHVEIGQRRMREEERLSGEAWRARFFSIFQEPEPFVTRMVTEEGLELERDKTGGIWRFDEGRAGGAKAPYHGDLTPRG